MTDTTGGNFLWIEWVKVALVAERPAKRFAKTLSPPHFQDAQ